MNKQPNYFYPRSPCGERLPLPPARETPGQISTHALHAESDFLRSFLLRNLISISTHALHAESDGFPTCTPPFLANFYPRSPCGERPAAKPKLDYMDISTHALHAESDIDKNEPYIDHRQFLPTLSMRRATIDDFMDNDLYTQISTHALHAESDSQTAGQLSLRNAISTHALHAESDRLKII